MQSFAVSDVPLIAQTKDMACWYASARMLIAWRQARVLACEAAHPDPSQVPKLHKNFLANDGLGVSQVKKLAVALGLQGLPPMSPSPGMIAAMLKKHGPLWFAGLHPSGHVVVITGITPEKLSINDPWPVDKGSRYDMSLYRFAEILQPLEGKQGTGFAAGSLASNILYFPG